MASFTTRVELIDAKGPEDYNILHEEMEKRNFTTTIRASDCKVYELPRAEYNRQGEYTIEQTLDAAIEAANATGKENRVLVTEVKSRSWNNLEEAKK